MRISLVFLLFIACLLLPRSADGQVLISLLLGDKVSSEKFHLGVNVGGNVSNLSGLEDTKVRTGLNLGVIGEWRFAKTWYLQPELVPFYWAGAKNLPESAFPLPPEAEDLLTDPEVESRLKYFVIPVLLKFGMAENRLLLGVGPQIGFLMSSSTTFKGTTTSGNALTVEEDRSGSTADTDAGAVFNVEWKIRKGAFSPGLNARFYLGMLDVITDNPGDAVYNRALSVLLTIPIGGGSSELDPDG